MAKTQEKTIHPDPEQFALDPTKSGQVPPVQDEPEADTERPAPGPTPAEAAALRRAEAAERSSSELLSTVTALARPVPVAQPQPKLPDVTLDLEGLPDPASDKDGFLKGLGQRLGTTVGQASARAAETATRQAQGMIQQQQLLDSTWGRFRSEHSDIAQHEEIVEAAAKRVSNGLRSRGIDPETYLGTNQDQFLESLAAETTRTLNRIKGLNEDGTDPAANEDDGRDGVIPDRPSGTRRGTKPGRETPSLFTDEIKATQKALKLF